MKLHYAIILSGSLALVGLTASTLAQKPKGPSIGKVKGGSPSGPSIGKSAVEGTGTKAEQGRVIDIPRVKVVQVAPNKGYLALFTRPHARVVITPLSGENEPGKPLSPGIADTEGLVVFPGLAPGNYKLEITCQDYEPLDDTVNIEKGKQTARLAPLASKFATLRIGLAGQADKDVLVKLNNEPFEKTKIEAGQLVFERVPVGKQTFTFSKAGYQDWTQEFEIRPGNNFFSAAMKEAVVAVTIQTQPHAEVYIDSDAKREASETGELYCHSCVNAASQWAGIAALQGPQDAVDAMCKAFDERRRYIVGALNQTPGFRCVEPGGAFYAFPNIEGTGMTAKQAQTKLLEVAGVATVAGTSFGAHGEGYIRFSYANSLDNIKEAIRRIGDVLRG